MPRVFKKLLITVTVLIVIIIGYNILIFTITNSDNSYKIISNQNNKFDFLFNPNFTDSLSIIGVVGNEHEQLYFYNYSDKYKITIWNILGFTDIDLSKTHLFTVENLSNVVFSDKNFSNIGNYRLSSQLSPLELTELNIYAQKGMTLISHEENKEFSFIDIKSDCIAIGNNKNFLIKIEGGKIIHFNIGFINKQSGFQLIIISKEQGILEDDLFFKLFR